jgi:N-carbamoyl-L-amino-acid hydrolase
MLALASTVLAAREAATAKGCVATVGKVRVEPNGVNAIPSRVTAWLDARGRGETDVRAVVEAVTRQSGGAAVEESWTPETAFDVPLAKRLSGWLEDAPMLATGAGHDAGVLATGGLSTAMLFVRNPTGISHSPSEFAEREDCHRGVEALARVTEELTR